MPGIPFLRFLGGTQIRSSRLTRTRLNERLESATKFPVTLIIAPAGFGKSVALRDFLERTIPDAVRYDVRREDGTLLAFVRRLSEALEPVAPTAIAAFPAMQERVLAADEPVRQLSDWFSEHLNGVSCCIAIDDLHYAATDPAAIALLADLIERTGDRITWIVAARSDVGLPVATWVAYGRMDLPLGEEELRFTTSEALAAADASAEQIEAQEVEALRQLTEGWPVALTIALRTRTHSANLRSASSGTREMVYRYLAEQVLAALTPGERSLAKAIAVFSTFDAEIANALGASPEMFEQWRAKIAFWNEVAPGRYRYHDLFRDFLETELRRAGQNEWIPALSRGAGILEKRGDDAGALALYTKAQAENEIVRLMERCGLSLFERGEGEVLAAAFDALPEEKRGGNAMLTGIHAMIEAGRGRYELSDRAYRSAIESAEGQPDLRVLLVQRYGMELVRRGRDCTALLEPYANEDGIDPPVLATILGTLSTAYVRSNRRTDALVTIEKALRMLDRAGDDAVRARVLQQAAYVYRYADDVAQARSYAQRAVEVALARNMYEVASRAYSVLYTIVYDEQDDPQAALEVLERLSEAARKGASSQARLFALIGSYEIEVERGNTAAIEQLDASVRESRAVFPQAYAQALIPADALRAAWSGDFTRAHELLAGTAADQSDPERRALRWAEIALYASAAGLHAESDAAIHNGAALLEELGLHSRRLIRAQLFLAVSELVRGRASTAHQRLTSAERSLPANAARLRALANAVRSVLRRQLGQADEAEAAAAIERLGTENFGGLGRLLGAIPLGESAEQGYSSLTVAEREILKMLARGASTKEIADKSGRSPHTVDTHIRSICRKLRCSGRREAVALATSSGWVQA